MHFITEFYSLNTNYPNFGGNSANAVFISNRVLEIEKDSLSKIKLFSPQQTWEFCDKDSQLYFTTVKWRKNYARMAPFLLNNIKMCLGVYTKKTLNILKYIFETMFPIQNFNEGVERILYTIAIF